MAAVCMVWPDNLCIKMAMAEYFIVFRCKLR